STIITTILPGLAAPCLGNTGACPAITGTAPGSLFTNGVVPTGTPSPTTWNLTIPENYIDALRDSTQISGTAPTNDTRIAVSLSGIPVGVTIGGGGIGAPGPCTLVGTTGGPTFATGSATSFTSTTPTVT